MKASGQWVERKRLMRFSDGEWACLLRGCFPGSSITADFFFNFMKTSWLTITLLALTVICTQAQDASTPPWQDTDIGAAPQAGGAQSDGADGYIVSSAGGDIWGGADSFHFVYQSLNGNGQVVARVLGIQGTSDWAKAGVIARETLDANSRNAMTLVALRQGTSFQWRSATGGSSDHTIGSPNVAAPYWVKIVRSGDWIGGYSSPDGVNWILVGWQTISGLAAQVYVGLAVTSHDEQGSFCTASFDQVSVSPTDPSEVLNPLVGTGDGLMGSYYPNRHLHGTPVTNRVDGLIDFDFQYLVRQGATNAMIFTNQCLAVLGMPKKDEFSVRWNGEMQAQFTEPYTLSAESDDGVRVWLNEQLIIDDWFSHSNKEASATVNLVAGQRYLLRVEYFQNRGDTRMKLSWSSPSTPKRVIPQSQLYSQPTDTDGNGLPDLWQQHYFGHTGVDPKADPDGDGLSNLQEYKRHSDPTSPLNWGVPNKWTHGDIEEWGGSDGSDGSTSYSNGVFKVSSAGNNNIWGRNDTFHYLYQPIGTNGEIVARILGIEGTNAGAEAGVMMRETLASDARNVMLLMTPSNGMAFQWREAVHSGTEQNFQPTNPATPCWLKLVRNNEWLGGYVSADGTNWTLFDWETIKGLAPQVFVGLAVTAYNTEGPGGTSTAHFDQVNVGPADPAKVLNPVVGDGDGLLGNYRNDNLLYLPGITNQVDAQVKFWWVHDPPMSFLNPDSYGVCWSGEVQAQFTEPYTFSLTCRQEDWVRVWVNEQLIINGWRTGHEGTWFTGTLNLVAGQHYLIRVEMFNNLGRGAALLRWSSPSTPVRSVPQSQLYSQPAMDPDGSGLPVIWEMIYFGHTGVDPNADPDGDGLSNLQEYKYHTNPTKADTDGDGLPDAWEIAHGLDPQFDDANLDYDNAGWSNLQKYLYGLDPFNSDVNEDGLPDSFEVQYLGLDTAISHADLTSVAASANGSQATNFLGNWQVDGNDIYALDRRGGLDFILSVSNADKYVFNLIGTQNQFNPFETKFKLLLGIDGQTLDHYTLNAGYGTNGEVALVLPYLKAGTHTVHVFWDGVASYSSLRIKQVKLLAVSGTDTNHNGIKDWADKMLADESGLDLTNNVIGSYTSPVCLEGRDPYPAMMTLTNNLVPTATSDGRWYVNAPLQASTQTVFQAGYQNGALTETRHLQWLPVNLLAVTNSLVIRKGDSLLLTALPANGVNGNLQIIIGGTNTYTGKAAKGIACKFTTPGVYTVTGTYLPASGPSKSGSITVNVVPQQNLPNVQPAAWTWMMRNLNLPNLAPEATLQADSRLACFISGTNANGAVQLTLATGENEAQSVIARLGTNGPVLDSTQVSGFDVWSGGQAYTKVLQVYSDGSQLVEMLMISSPVETNVTFVLKPIVSGVMFDDGTMLKTLTATNFDALGQCPVRFIRPASAQTSVCNQIQAYQGNYQLGYRH
jgi:hypothetical protein